MPESLRRAALATTLAAALALAGCGTEDEGSSSSSPPSSEAGGSSAPESPASSPTVSQSAGEQSETGPAEPQVAGTVASGLEVPWGLTFLPDGSAVVTERDSARVLLLTGEGEEREVTEVGRVEAAAPEVEGGLLGVAASPDFDADRTLFFYVTAAEDNRIVKAELDGDRLGEPEPVLTGIPRGVIHDGGRLLFGPDGHLYVSTGEIGEPELAQDRSSLAGKILRITPDGDPAPGNPDPASPVWSWGHRNVQGLAFDDEDRLWASEFGDSTWDELNLVRKGGNYGWPRVEGRAADNPGVSAEGLTDPYAVWSTDEASPSGLAFADGSLWLGALRGARLWQVPVTSEGVGKPRAHFVGDYGRLRSVASAPDGSLWMTTSNRDGRGSPASDDDRILRVTLSR